MVGNLKKNMKKRKKRNYCERDLDDILDGTVGVQDIDDFGGGGCIVLSLLGGALVVREALATDLHEVLFLEAKGVRNEFKKKI